MEVFRTKHVTATRLGRIAISRKIIGCKISQQRSYLHSWPYMSRRQSIMARANSTDSAVELLSKQLIQQPNNLEQIQQLPYLTRSYYVPELRAVLTSQVYKAKLDGRELMNFQVTLIPQDFMTQVPVDTNQSDNLETDHDHLARYFEQCEFECKGDVSQQPDESMWLHWGVSKSRDGRWQKIPGGWFTNPSACRDAGGNAWQTAFSPAIARVAQCPADWKTVDSFGQDNGMVQEGQGEEQGVVVQGKECSCQAHSVSISVPFEDALRHGGVAFLIKGLNNQWIKNKQMHDTNFYIDVKPTGEGQESCGESTPSTAIWLLNKSAEVPQWAQVSSTPTHHHDHGNNAHHNGAHHHHHEQSGDNHSHRDDSKDDSGGSMRCDYVMDEQLVCDTLDGLEMSYVSVDDSDVMIHAKKRGGIWYKGLLRTNHDLTHRIADTEHKARRSLMHRYTAGADLVRQFVLPVRKNTMLTTSNINPIALWLRLAASRRLTWNHNYNVKPRQISAACRDITQQLTQSLMRDWNAPQPAPREELWQPRWELVKLALGSVGRGGDGSQGQRVRDEILTIQSKHRLKGGMLEQWHQKLHNNSSPDDVHICNALIAYCNHKLSKLNNTPSPARITLGKPSATAPKTALEAYWQVLHEAGIDAQRLKSFDRAINSEPDIPDDVVQGLVTDLEQYKVTLDAVLGGEDLWQCLLGVVGYSQHQVLGKQQHVKGVVDVADTNTINKLVTSALGVQQVLAKLKGAGGVGVSSDEEGAVEGYKEVDQFVNVCFKRVVWGVDDGSDGADHAVDTFAELMDCVHDEVKYTFVCAALLTEARRRVQTAISKIVTPYTYTDDTIPLLYLDAALDNNIHTHIQTAMHHTTNTLYTLDTDPQLSTPPHLPLALLHRLWTWSIENACYTCGDADQLQCSYEAAADLDVGMVQECVEYGTLDQNTLLQVAANIKRVSAVLKGVSKGIIQSLTPDAQELVRLLKLDGDADGKRGKGCDPKRINAVAQELCEDIVRGGGWGMVGLTTSTMFGVVQEMGVVDTWTLVAGVTGEGYEGSGVVCQNMGELETKVRKSEKLKRAVEKGGKDGEGEGSTEWGEYVCFVQDVLGGDDIPPFVSVLCTRSDIDVLAHVAIRARESGILLLTCVDKEAFQDLANACTQSPSVSVTYKPPSPTINPANSSQSSHTPHHLRTLSTQPTPPTLPPPHTIIPPQNVRPTTNGAKSCNLAAMSKHLAAYSQTIRIPEYTTIALGALAHVLNHERNTQVLQFVRKQVVAGVTSHKGLNGSGGITLAGASQPIMRVLGGMYVPPDVYEDVVREVCALGWPEQDIEKGPEARKRGGEQVEDLEDVVSDELPCGESSAMEGLAQTIWNVVMRVYASKYATTAMATVVNAGVVDIVDRVDVGMICQRVINASYAFVVHTCNPQDTTGDSVMVQLVRGLGETLAASHDGTPLTIRVTGTGPTLEPYRSSNAAVAPLTPKQADAAVGMLDLGVHVVEHSSKGNQVVLQRPTQQPALTEQGMLVAPSVIIRSDSNVEDMEHFSAAGLFHSEVVCECVTEPVRYGASDVLTWDAVYREELVGKIVKACVYLACVEGTDLDVEGCVDDQGEVYFVQMRPQV